MITEHSIIVAVDQQVSGELPDGEAVILNLKNGVYYGLNQVGARIWSMIKKPISVSEICKALLNEYDVEEDHCVRDVLSLLNEMYANQLISIQEEGIHTGIGEL